MGSETQAALHTRECLTHRDTGRLPQVLSSSPSDLHILLQRHLLSAWFAEQVVFPLPDYCRRHSPREPGPVWSIMGLVVSLDRQFPSSGFIPYLGILNNRPFPIGHKVEQCSHIVFMKEKLWLSSQERLLDLEPEETSVCKMDSYTHVSEQSIHLTTYLSLLFIIAWFRAAPCPVELICVVLDPNQGNWQLERWGLCCVKSQVILFSLFFFFLVAERQNVVRKQN